MGVEVVFLVIAGSFISVVFCSLFFLFGLVPKHTVRSLAHFTSLKLFSNCFGS